MKRHKRVGFLLMFILGIFILGTVMGSSYAVGLGDAESTEIYDYLCSFFENSVRSNKEIFFASLFDNIKIFSVIFMAGFFKLGTVMTTGVVCMEGFISGFTHGTLIKLMGWKGFLLGASGLFSILVFVSNLVFYSAFSVNFAISGQKTDIISKKRYMIISAVALTIFCIASVFDGYITTIFMNLVVTRM